MLTRKGQDLLGVAALVGSLALASTIAVWPIRVSQHPIAPLPGASPFGYTVSLALFAVPCAVLGIWLGRRRQTPEQRRACVLTLLLLIPLGFGLDIVFGRIFLRFPNLQATLGWLLPGFDLRSGWSGLWGAGWKRTLPVEEFAFYALGFVAMLLVYIWGDEVLYYAYKVDHRQRTPAVFRGWKQTLSFWLAVGLVLFGAALAVRSRVPSESGHAFPGYFLFLLLGSIVPSLFCSRVAFQFINWRALTTSWLFTLAISQFWEGTLGIPYGWWGYDPDQMMDIFIKPHCDLPIEAVLVWTLGSWTTVIIYETVLTAVYAERKGWRLFGVVTALETELAHVKRKHLRDGRAFREGNEDNLPK